MHYGPSNAENKFNDPIARNIHSWNWMHERIQLSHIKTSDNDDDDDASKMPYCLLNCLAYASAVAVNESQSIQKGKIIIIVKKHKHLAYDQSKYHIHAAGWSDGRMVCVSVCTKRIHFTQNVVCNNRTSSSTVTRSTNWRAPAAPMTTAYKIRSHKCSFYFHVMAFYWIVKKHKNEWHGNTTHIHPSPCKSII